MKRRVFAIGETVLDIIFKQGAVEGARPGGSMLNAAVSLGRLGVPVSLVSAFANDEVGRLIRTFLSENGVNCRHVLRFDQGKTPLALAFLDEWNEASYIFYKSFPNTDLIFEMPEFQNDDVVLFGSYFGIDPTFREQIRSMVLTARSRGAMIIYDPNFRKPHLNELTQLLPAVTENFNMAHLVRMSHEDCRYIFNVHHISEARKLIGEGPEILIMTHGGDALYLDSRAANLSLPVKKIQALSTIGAGDSFNAGLIFGMLRSGIRCSDLANLSIENWLPVIEMAVDFASDVCMGLDNYISNEYVAKLNKNF